MRSYFLPTHAAPCSYNMWRATPACKSRRIVEKDLNESGNFYGFLCSCTNGCWCAAEGLDCAVIIMSGR
jgi:hypothetical protein